MDEAEHLLFTEHPSFNEEYYQEVLNLLMDQARVYGLEWEVTNTFHSFLESRFKTNDYPVSRFDYLNEANDALYEWDI